MNMLYRKIIREVKTEMAVCVDELKKLVLDNASTSNRIIIISGYATPDTVEEIAKLNIETVFYYGMYRRRGLTSLTLKKLCDLDMAYQNLTVNIVYDYHVHTKCYLFYDHTKVVNALIGSANCSIDGLSSGVNSEMLVELNSLELKNDNYLKRLALYAVNIERASVKCNDPSIVMTVSTKKESRKKLKLGQYPKSSNPYIAYMPLYTWEKNNKVVKKKSGLNWGLQSGHARKGSGYAEAYIKVTANLIDDHPILFPFFPSARATTSGRSSRRYDPVTVLWDDGTVMKMIFSGTGVERPTKKNRNPGDPFHQFPKQFTSGKDEDGGGAELGEYLRKRMNVSEKHLITMKDFKDYGRDCIELTYINDGYYEANFAGTSFSVTRK